MKPLVALASLMLIVSVSGAASDKRWELVKRDRISEMAIARDSVLGDSSGIVSAWIRHRPADGYRTLERHEVNCATQQRRLVEVWMRPELPDSAPVAQRYSGWTHTERNTTMREVVVRVCALWNRARS